MTTMNDEPTLYEAPFITGDESRDYAKQLGDQVLHAQDDLLEALNRGNIPEKDIPRILRMILKDNWFAGSGSSTSPLMSLPRRHQEILIWAHARNGIDGKRVDTYLNSIGGFMMAAARSARKKAGEVAGKLSGE